MTWEATASEHIDDPAGRRHRMVLLSPRELSCLDCSRKLILPKDTTANPTPSAYRKPEVRGVPMPSGFRERVWADLKHRREARAEQYPEATT